MTWAPDYISSTQFKSYVRITDTADDNEIGFAITTASRAIDDLCNRQFGTVAAAEEREYRAEYDRHQMRVIITIDDLMTTTDLVVTVDGAAITDYTLYPRNAVLKGRPWTLMVLGPSITAITAEGNLVSIEAKWGWTAVPTAVVQATLLQSSRFFARRNSPWGIIGSPDSGGEISLKAAVDPDVRVALRKYIRMWGAK